MTERSKQSKIIAAMPAFNEARYLGTIVLKTRQYADEVIVVDDGSTDNTSEIARLAGATVIRHEKNQGYGAAIQSIIAEAKKMVPEVLVILDADSQHNPDEIPNLIKPIREGFDLVIGSRMQQRNNIPLYRRIGQNIILRSTNILSDKKLSDSESGFRAFSQKAIAVLELKQSGMAVSAETVAEATAKGLKVAEVPITVTYTKDGSTLNPVAHGLEVLFRVITMISQRRPLFFFGLGGLALVLIGLIVGGIALRILTTTGVIPVEIILVSSTLFIIGILSVFTGIILHVISMISSKNGLKTN